MRGGEATFVGTLAASLWNAVDGVRLYWLPRGVLLGAVVLLCGVIAYVVSVEQHRLVSIEIKHQRKIVEVSTAYRLELSSQLEALRSPENLSLLAKKYHMVMPGPHNVWKLP